jgi:hypothetical protein
MLSISYFINNKFILNKPGTYQLATDIKVQCEYLMEIHDSNGGLVGEFAYLPAVVAKV